MFIFAHRGASAHAPENTLRAVEIALEQGADGVELDVHQHGDEFILIHDRWVQRTTNGYGELADLSFTELRKLDAGNGQQIPTLAEVMAVIDGRCELNIEMKGIQSAAHLLDYVAHHQQGFTADQIVYSSFNHRLLKTIRQLSDQAILGALTASLPVDYARFAEDLGAQSVNPDVTFVTAEFVDDAKQRGLKVFSYTVDEPADILRLRDWRVDGIFANSPVNARKALTA